MLIRQVSTAAYRHRLNVLQVMVRGALIGLIHQHGLTAYSSADDDGRSVTLIGTDVPSIQNSGGMLHDTWGYAFEVAFGFLFLASEVGWVWPLPILLLFRRSSSMENSGAIS